MEWVKKMIHNVEFSKISLLRLYSMKEKKKYIYTNFIHRFVSPPWPVSHMNGSLWQKMEVGSGPEFILMVLLWLQHKETFSL